MQIRSSLLRIYDMLESIQGIEKAIKGKSYREYQRSWVLRSAVERGIEVISEASAHFPKFVLHRSTHLHELRKVMGTSKHIDSSTALSI